MRDVWRIARLYAAQGTGLFKRTPPPGAVLPVAEHAAGLSQAPKSLSSFVQCINSTVQDWGTEGLHFTKACLGCCRDKHDMIDRK